MAIINFTKVGSLVDITVTGHSPRLINAKRDDFELGYNADGSKISIYAKGVQYPPVEVTDVSVGGVAATDLADLKSKLATVFSDEGGGSGETPGIDDVISVDQEVKDVDDNTMMWFSKLGRRVQLEMVSTDEEDPGFAAMEPGQLRVGPNATDYAVIKATEVEGLTSFELPAEGGKILTDATQPLEYIASISQSGTDAPVVTVMKDDFGDISFSYVGEGRYTAVSAGAQFTVGLTEASLTNNIINETGYFAQAMPTEDGSTVEIETGKMDAGLKNDVLSQQTSSGSTTLIKQVFKISVYPAP